MLRTRCTPKIPLVHKNLRRMGCMLTILLLLLCPLHTVCSCSPLRLQLFFLQGS
jgi:hypothetical protein